MTNVFKVFKGSRKSSEVWTKIAIWSLVLIGPLIVKLLYHDSESQKVRSPTIQSQNGVRNFNARYMVIYESTKDSQNDLVEVKKNISEMIESTKNRILGGSLVKNKKKDINGGRKQKYIELESTFFTPSQVRNYNFNGFNFISNNNGYCDSCQKSLSVISKQIDENIQKLKDYLERLNKIDENKVRVNRVVDEIATDAALEIADATLNNDLIERNEIFSCDNK